MRRSLVIATAILASTAFLGSCAAKEDSSDTTAAAGASTTTAADAKPATDVRADGLGGITGWEPTPPVCGSGSLTPVVVANTYDTPMSYSITVNQELSTQVAFSDDGAVALGCSRPEIDNGTAYTQDVTVPANGTSIAYLFMGGVDHNLIETSHSIAIGAGGSQWYDFNLNLNGDESFENVQLNYDGTGGTDTSQNVQTGLFNVMACDPVNNPTAATGINVTSTIVSNYSDKDTQPYSYGSGQPICFGFLQPGS